MTLPMYLSIITLNENGLNAPTKRHGVAEWIRQQDPYIWCLLRLKDEHRLKIKGWKKILHANGNKEEAEVAIHIPDKLD